MPAERVTVPPTRRSTTSPRLSDDVGLFEHAEHAVPRPEHGYCVDDMARGCWSSSAARAAPDAGGRRLWPSATSPSSLDAQGADGRFHNRRGPTGGAGRTSRRSRTAGAARCGRSARPARAVRRSCDAPTARSSAFDARRGQRGRRWPRAMAFAALGAAEVLAVRPGPRRRARPARRRRRARSAGRSARRRRGRGPSRG